MAYLQLITNIREIWKWTKNNTNNDLFQILNKQLEQRHLQEKS